MTQMYPSNFVWIGDLRKKVKSKRPDINMDGDCSAWAILSAVHKAGKDLCYLDLAKEIVQLKQDRHSIYSSRSGYDEYWFNYHGSLPTELISEILDNHLDLSFTEVKPIGFIPLRKVAESFRQIPIALASTPRHISFISQGNVYDTWDSTERYVVSVLVPSIDAEMALSIFQGLDQDNRIDLGEPERQLSDSERTMVAKIQSKICLSETYRKTLWVLTQSHGQTSFVRLTELVEEAILRGDSPRSWKGEVSKNLIRSIIRYLDSQKVLDASGLNTPGAWIFRTKSTIAILRNLKFD